MEIRKGLHFLEHWDELHGNKALTSRSGRRRDWSSRDEVAGQHIQPSKTEQTGNGADLAMILICAHRTVRFSFSSFLFSSLLGSVRLNLYPK